MPLLKVPVLDKRSILSASLRGTLLKLLNWVVLFAISTDIANPFCKYVSVECESMEGKC